MTSKIESLVRLIEYCVLFVRFRHDCDKACHKCIPDETQLPIEEQLSWSTAMYFVSKMIQKYKCYGAIIQCTCIEESQSAVSKEVLSCTVCLRSF